MKNKKEIIRLSSIKSKTYKLMGDRQFTQLMISAS